MNKLFIDTDVLIDFSHGKSHLLENILKEKQTELFLNPVIIAEFFTDEALKGETEGSSSWKDRLKRAFFVITSSYIVSTASMIPLLFAGAGLLKGFAITSILAVTVGIFITRPAYAAIVHLLIEE